MKLNDKVYEAMKWVAVVFLPALTTLYGVIGSTLHIPHTQEVLTIAVAVDTFIGSLIGISTLNYRREKLDE